MLKRASLILLIALAASPALASESAGMPQMDPTWFKNQLFWLAVSFALLYVIVSSTIAPGVGKVLKKREEAIRTAIAKAEELKATAAATRGDFEAGLNDARTKAAAMIAKAQAEAAQTAVEAQAQLAAELETKNGFATQAVAKAVAKARTSVDDAADELAEAMVAKLLGDMTLSAAAPAAKMKKA